jgi:hypothetical protein
MDDSAIHHFAIVRKARGSDGRIMAGKIMDWELPADFGATTAMRAIPARSALGVR